jgi:hypothetical protein
MNAVPYRLRGHGVTGTAAGLLAWPRPATAGREGCRYGLAGLKPHLARAGRQRRSVFVPLPASSARLGTETLLSFKGVLCHSRGAPGPHLMPRADLCTTSPRPAAQLSSGRRNVRDHALDQRGQTDPPYLAWPGLWVSSAIGWHDNAAVRVARAQPRPRSAPRRADSRRVPPLRGEPRRDPRPDRPLR